MSVYFFPNSYAYFVAAATAMHGKKVSKLSFSRKENHATQSLMIIGKPNAYAMLCHAMPLQPRSKCQRLFVSKGV
jgi:hypothetical protein